MQKALLGIDCQSSDLNDSGVKVQHVIYCTLFIFKTLYKKYFNYDKIFNHKNEKIKSLVQKLP